MVRVPQVSQQAGLSAQIQAPGVAPVQDQTGRQLQQFGRGLEIAGQGAQRLGDEITESEDNARIKEADALFADYVRGALNPNDGYRSRLGKDAGEGYKQVQQDIADKRKFLAGTLRNDRQRQLFDQTAQVRVGQAQGVIDGHAAQQTRVYEMAETAASIEGRKADYQASLGDPNAMALHMQLLRNDVADLAEMNGRGPKEAKRMLLEQETAMHGAALDGFIGAGETASARDYFRAYEGSMEVGARERARSIISKAELGDRAQSLLMKHADKSLLDVIELSDKEHAAGKISDKVRAEWVRRAESRTLVTRRETSIREANALQQAQEMIALGPLPPDVQQELEDTDQQWKLDAWVAGDGAWKTTPYGFKQYLTVTDGELAEFKSAEEVFSTYRAEMSDRDLGGMVARWKGVQVAIGKAAGLSDEDALKINRDKQLRVLYRKRLGGDIDAEKADFDEADFERWSFDLETRANSIKKEKGLGDIDALNAAYEQMEALPTTAGKSFFGMTADEQQGAQLETSLGTLDMNLIDEQRLQAARQKLVDANNARIAANKPAIELTPQGLYEQAHADLLAENVQTQKDTEDLKERGRSMLRQRVRMLKEDPQAIRAMNSRWATAHRTDLWGRSVTRTVRSNLTPTEILQGMAIARFGESISADFGLSPDEVEETVKALLDPKTNAMAAGAAAGLGGR